MAKGLVLNIDTTKSEFQNPMVELRQGDGNYQSLHVTVTSNGEPFDLTGWTINFMGTTAGGHKIVDAASVVESMTQGVFNYTPTKAWGQDIGEFSKAYFKFTKDDEAASGANFRVKVFEAVDLTQEEAGDYISVVDVMIDKIKTDMDTKLSETQTTLTNTQNQAHTVQDNVDALNTNVNDLKAQNNNIRTADNTWSGNNTFINTRTQFKSGADFISDAGPEIYAALPYIDFHYNNDNGDFTSRIIEQSEGKLTFLKKDGSIMTIGANANDPQAVHNSGDETINGNKTFTSPINGSLAVKEAQFTDFDDVAKNMVKYAGDWFVGMGRVNNSPASNYYSVKVTPAINDGGSGYIEVVPFASGWQGKFISVVGSSTLGSWNSFAVNGTVVHNTGDETISGTKTFNGSLSVTTGGNNVNIQQSATVEFNSWQSSKMKATRFGNMVALRYSVLPNNNNTITKNQTSSVVIPLGFRPIEQWNMAVGGVSAGSNVLVNPDGTLTSGWQDVQYAGMMTAMYFTSDPFPS